MGISFERALGIHESALNVRTRRAEVLANNLANADTPGFKARDIDFAAILNDAKRDDAALSMAQTSAGHIDLSTAPDSDLMYRNPLQPSIDGNTVDAQQEMASYAKNAMDFEASFQFLNSKFRGLMSAIKGE